MLFIVINLIVIVVALLIFIRTEKWYQLVMSVVILGICIPLLVVQNDAKHMFNDFISYLFLNPFLFITVLFSVVSIFGVLVYWAIEIRRR